MIPLLPALLLLLMQGSLNGDALEGRVQQLWLARLTGHSTHLDQAEVEEVIAALLTSCQDQTVTRLDGREALFQGSFSSSKDPRLPNASPRDGPQV